VLVEVGVAVLGIGVKVAVLGIDVKVLVGAGTVTEDVADADGTMMVWVGVAVYGSDSAVRVKSIVG
jgi:hypothetical protein